MTQVPSGLVPLFFRSLGCRFHYVYISLYHISLYYIILFYIAGTSKLVSSLSCIVIEIPYIYIYTRSPFLWQNEHIFITPYRWCCRCGGNPAKKDLKIQI